MFTNDSAAITAAIRAGSLQQVQAEPRHQRSATGVTAGRQFVAVRVGAPRTGR